MLRFFSAEDFFSVGKFWREIISVSSTFGDGCFHRKIFFFSVGKKNCPLPSAEDFFRRKKKTVFSFRAASSKNGFNFFFSDLSRSGEVRAVSLVVKLPGTFFTARLEGLCLLLATISSPANGCERCLHCSIAEHRRGAKNNIQSSSGISFTVTHILQYINKQFRWCSVAASLIS